MLKCSVELRRTAVWWYFSQYIRILDIKTLSSAALILLCPSAIPYLILHGSATVCTLFDSYIYVGKYGVHRLQTILVIVITQRK